MSKYCAVENQSCVMFRPGEVFHRMTQPVRMRVGQRLQQQRAQHGEDAGIHADAEREGQHGRGGERSMLREAAQREPCIAEERGQHGFHSIAITSAAA